jgi:CubicO group peptidase (beta-lactamase class C family)
MNHRSGLPRHDLVWASGPNITRETLVNNIQFLDSNLQFRSQFQYNNLMYTLAGYMLGQLAGTTWEDLVQAALFDPLDMYSTNTNVVESIASGNYAVSTKIISKRSPVVIYLRSYYLLECSRLYNNSFSFLMDILLSARKQFLFLHTSTSSLML